MGTNIHIATTPFFGGVRSASRRRVIVRPVAGMPPEDKIWHAGYCKATDTNSGDCSRPGDAMGSWTLSSSSAGLPRQLRHTCLQRCVACQGCAAVTLSPDDYDCSWYKAGVCDLGGLHTELGPRHATAIVRRDGSLLPAIIEVLARANTSAVTGRGRHEAAETISYLIQYYRQPETIVEHAARLRHPAIVEVLVHADSRTPEDRVALAAAKAELPGRLRIVWGDNEHEIRGYNRLAAQAVGSLLCFTQEDRMPPPNLRWLATAPAARAWVGRGCGQSAMSCASLRPKMHP